MAGASASWGGTASTPNPSDPTLDLTTRRPSSAVPEEWTTKFLAANPGATPVDAAKSFLVLPPDQMRSWQQPAPESSPGLIDRVRDAVHGALGTATEGVTTALAAPYLAQHKAMQALGIIPKDQEQDVSGERLLARTIVPQTLGQVAGTAANLVVPGSGFIPALFRIGLSAGAGAGGNWLSGDDPTLGALQGGVGAAAGEAAAGLWNRFGAQRTGILTRIAADDAKRVGTAIGREAPALGGVTDAGELQDLAKGTGQQKIGQRFEAGQQDLLRQTGDPQVSVPALDQYKARMKGGAGGPAASPAAAGPAQQLARQLGTTPDDPRVAQILARAGLAVPPPSAGPTMKLSEALDLVKRLGAEASWNKADASGFDLRELYRDAQQQITTQLGPQLGPAYQGMRDEYTKGVAILHALNSPGVFTRAGDVISLNLNPIKDGTGANLGTPLQAAVTDNLRKFGDGRMADFAGAVYRGGRVGGGDAIRPDLASQLAAWFRFHPGGGVGASVGENLNPGGRRIFSGGPAGTGQSLLSPGVANPAGIVGARVLGSMIAPENE